MSSNEHDSHSDFQVRFLTGLDPLPRATQAVAARPEAAARAADGSAVVAAHGVVFRADVTDAMARGADPAAAACGALVAAARRGEPDLALLARLPALAVTRGGE